MGISWTRSDQMTLPAARAEFAARPVRVDPVSEQHLSSIDISNPGQDRLIHQQGGNGPTGPLDPAPGQVGIGIPPERIWPQGSDLRLDLGARLDRTQLRTAQVGHRLRRRQSQPHLAARWLWI